MNDCIDYRVHPWKFAYMWHIVWKKDPWEIKLIQASLIGI